MFLRWNDYATAIVSALIFVVNRRISGQKAYVLLASNSIVIIISDFSFSISAHIFRVFLFVIAHRA